MELSGASSRFSTVITIAHGRLEQTCSVSHTFSWEVAPHKFAGRLNIGPSLLGRGSLQLLSQATQPRPESRFIACSTHWWIDKKIPPQFTGTIQFVPKACLGEQRGCTLLQWISSFWGEGGRRKEEVFEPVLPSTAGPWQACRPSENTWSAGPPRLPSKTTRSHLIFAKSKPRSECVCTSERRDSVGGKPDVAKQKAWGCSLEFVFNSSVGECFSK